MVIGTIMNDSKICQVCKIKKPLSEFYRSKIRSDGLRANCIECGRKEARQSYHNNPEPYKRRAKHQRSVIRHRRSRWINEIKTEYGCQLCKENSLEILDFHHLDPSVKEYNILAVSGKGIKNLINEINKCVVLCANCHRRVHAKTRKVNDSMLCKISLPEKHLDGKYFH